MEKNRLSISKLYQNVPKTKYSRVQMQSRTIEHTIEEVEKERGKKYLERLVELPEDLVPHSQRSDTISMDKTVNSVTSKGPKPKKVINLLARNNRILNLAREVNMNTKLKSRLNQNKEKYRDMVKLRQ